MKITTHKELIVWKKSMDLVKEVYILTNQFPKEELYGLTSQIRRAVVSIPSNIAEGHVRRHKKEFIHHLSIALGSAAELETQILICKGLSTFKHINFSSVESLLQEILKMLYVMIERMEQ